mgnify:CR=1 FL=1
MIQQRVIRYIEKEHLFSPDDKLLVALSGGADSVALLRVQQVINVKLPTAISIYAVKNQTVTNSLSGNFAKNTASACIPSTSTRLSTQLKNGSR